MNYKSIAASNQLSDSAVTYAFSFGSVLQIFFLPFWSFAFDKWSYKIPLFIVNAINVLFCFPNDSEVIGYLRTND